MTLNLNDREWKAFRVEYLFKVDKGVYLHKNKIIPGNSPYITATSNNNGITDFIGNNVLFSRNTITVEKISLSAFYQSADYYCSHDVSVLDNKNLNKFNSIFVSNMIKRQGVKYSYGRQAQLNVVKSEAVYLPIAKNGHPDWAFMEMYVKAIIDKKKNEYKEYAKKALDQIEYRDIKSLQDNEWKEFYVNDIFNVTQRGKRLTKENQTTGEIPYVSSTSLNNGVDNFIGNNIGVRTFSNCLTIANSGSVGASFFHRYEFVASDHITHLKNEKFSDKIYLFIAAITNRFSEKYNFNREINDKRISRERLMLPVTSDGKPDFEYMEQYVKNMEYKKRKEYLDYLGL